MPLAVALAVGAVVQVRLPIGATGLTFAGSDPVVGAALAVLIAWRAAPQRFLSAVPGLAFWIAAATAALVLSLAIGVSREGSATWAVIRLAGWAALVAHLVVAAWIAMCPRARDLALRVFVVAAAASFALDLVKLNARGALIFAPDCTAWIGDTMGLMQNPNAYGFVLLLALTVLASRLRDSLFASPKVEIAIGSVIVFALILSASRSAWIAALPVLGVLLVSGMAPRIRLVAIILGGSLLAGLFLGEIACEPRGAVTRDASMLASVMTSGLDKAALEAAKDAPNLERLYTFQRAWEMFRAHPVFGAGLGVFLAEEIARGNPPLIIHSTPLWLLAETGIVGFVAFLGLGVSIVAALVARLRAPAAKVDIDAVTALLVIMAFAVMAQAQELLYQRSLWVLLGLLIFCARAAAPEAPDERPGVALAPASNAT